MKPEISATGQYVSDPSIVCMPTTIRDTTPEVNGDPFKMTWRPKIGSHQPICKEPLE